MVYFKTVCVPNNLNPQVLLYDVHYSHFDDRDIHIILSGHIKPFILKAGDSVNYQPNDNGSNLNLKGIYVQSGMNWQRQNGTLGFMDSRMSVLLLETGIVFQISTVPIIINPFRKKNHVHLTPPDEDTN